MINIGKGSWYESPTIGTGRKCYVAFHVPTQEIVKVSGSARLMMKDPSNVLRAIENANRVLALHIVSFEKKAIEEAARDVAEPGWRDKLDRWKRNVPAATEVAKFKKAMNILDNCIVVLLDETAGTKVYDDDVFKKGGE